MVESSAWAERGVEKSGVTGLTNKFQKPLTKRYATMRDDNIIDYSKIGKFKDELTAILREGARRLLQVAVEAASWANS